MLPQPKHQRMSTVLNCYTQSSDHYFLLIHTRNTIFGWIVRQVVLQQGRIFRVWSTKFLFWIQRLSHLDLHLSKQQKDRLKVQLRGRKSINQLLRTKGGPEETVMLTNQGMYSVIDKALISLQLIKFIKPYLMPSGDLVESYVMDLKYDGLYRSWPFLTSRLVKDKTTIPLLESNIRHFMALEVHIYHIFHFSFCNEIMIYFIYILHC